MKKFIEGFVLGVKIWFDVTCAISAVITICQLIVENSRLGSGVRAPLPLL